MFKSKGLIIVVIIILALLGSALYLNLGKSSNTSENKTNSMDKSNQTAGEMVKGTIKNLFGAGKNVKCAINSAENNGTGTVYVAGKKMRGDFTSQVEGKTVKSHFIQDEEFSYIWSSEMDQGIKMKADLGTEETSASNSKENSTVKNQTMDLNKEVDYKCSNWTVDNSKFTPPSNIKFSDLTDLMMPKTTPSETDAINKIEGSPCDKLPDAESKAACEEALNQ
ncbi:MAG TPA: hypothetical protein VFD45_01100 [Patescibacteria group bacterium]|nr:hypothetical protein [Patescibacteria group bacterium]